VWIGGILWPVTPAVGCNAYDKSGASKGGTPGDEKFVTEILRGGGKNKDVTGNKVYLFVLRENKRIKLIKQSNNLLMNYE